MEFASEMVVKAALFKMRIDEVPTTLSPDGRDRAPHLRSWHDGWRHLRFLLLYSPRWLFLYPGLMLMILGVVAGFLLLGGPRTVGTIRFDIHTLLYAAIAILLGFQSVTFAFFSKVFAISEGLLPDDPNLNRLFRYVTLESGLAAAFILILTGLATSLLAVGSWGAVHFGSLDPERSLRLVIPAALSLTLGFEVMFSSFFLSVLGMKRKGFLLPGASLQSDFTKVSGDQGKHASNETERARAEGARRPSPI
jgi:hypothetical protein